MRKGIYELVAEMSVYMAFFVFQWHTDLQRNMHLKGHGCNGETLAHIAFSIFMFGMEVFPLGIFRDLTKPSDDGNFAEKTSIACH